MKLSEFMNHVNAALNFPAIDTNDVLVYCDMAMSELNTTLHTSIPSLSKQLDIYNTEEWDKIIYILLTENEDPATQEGNDIFVKTADNILPSNVKIYYDLINQTFMVWSNLNHVYEAATDILGVFYRDGVKEFWKPFHYGNAAMWEKSERIDESNYELNRHLPDDWILLWLIPYVCFKYTVRDGGTAQTFAEELTQGFQQLQDTYNVPNKVVLATVADKAAYQSLVKEKLPYLNVLVNTLAIYEEMKHERNVLSCFGSMYDRGGF